MAHVGKDNQLCARNGGSKIVRVSTSNEFFMVAIGDAANVFGDRRVRRAGPLAIDDFMEVIGMRDVSRLHDAVNSLPSSVGIRQNWLARIQTRFPRESSENNCKVILTR